VAAAALPAALRLPGEAGRACAPRPPKAIPKGLFTEMFLARLAYEKYVLGRPLHRIIAALAADGLDIAEGSLVGALAQIAPLLAPWARAIEAPNGAMHGRSGSRCCTAPTTPCGPR
jgi:transposase